MRISRTSTLIDNIFSNSASLEEIESVISHQHFWIVFHNLIFFSEIPVTKSNILRRDWKKFESSKFISDFNQINWEQFLCNEENDVNFSMNKHLSKIGSLLDTHVPFKKLNKKEMKFLTKLVDSQGLQNSIEKTNIYAKFGKCKNKIMKEFHHNNYRNYRNLLSRLHKRAKENYFTNVFNENIKDVKKT